MTERQKKICVVTRHAIVNYGSFLQTLATQEILESLNTKVIILDYIRSDEHYRNVTELLLKSSKKWNSNIIKKSIYRVVHYPDHLVSGIVFEQFRKKYLYLSERIISIEEDKGKIPQADIYCTGSDQVWGEIGDEEFDKVYFLDFDRKPKSYCIAFAASFGKSTYATERIKKFMALLQKYDSITVREKSAIGIVNCAGKNASNILDPTLIVGREFWDKQIPDKKYGVGKYVLIYQLNSSVEMDRYAVEFAKRVHLPLIRVSAEYYNWLKPGRFKWCLSPFDFMGYIKNAEYMITDSFHGTAFAIMFETQFVEVLPSEKKTRNKSILQQFNLESRILMRKNDFSFIENRIDYESVKEILGNEQKKSIELLAKLLYKNRGLINND